MRQDGMGTRPAHRPALYEQETSGLNHLANNCAFVAINKKTNVKVCPRRNLQFLKLRREIPGGALQEEKELRTVLNQRCPVRHGISMRQQGGSVIYVEKKRTNILLWVLLRLSRGSRMATPSRGSAARRKVEDNMAPAGRHRLAAILFHGACRTVSRVAAG
ncbi:hypothetical protein ABC383_11935 [Noviherbaspirillum sp. 1P10PC]|uniref:hypothetical protein n=1 Tax=Noviherbaspirillum sp. 1P10PC TaxID=3132292 RepID=UPI00399EF1E9